MLLSLPYSRQHEKEADILGLDIMIRACIDPAVATKVWEKMSQRGLHDHEYDDKKDKKKTRVEGAITLLNFPWFPVSFPRLLA